MQDSVGFGLIGCGVMGKVHAMAFEASPHVRFVTACDQDLERAAQFAADHGAGKHVADWRGVVEDPDIQAVYCRAQEVTPGSLFVAVKGFAADGHDYIDQAVRRGAAAVVCERAVPTPAATVVVENSRQALAAVSAAPSAADWWV